MRSLVLALLIFPFSLKAQTTEREKINSELIYEHAISNFIQQHPNAVVRTKKCPEKIIFLKKQEYLNKLKGTVQNTKIILVDSENNLDSMLFYFSKKQQFIMLDIQPLRMLDFNASIWILPMDVSLEPKKKKVTVNYNEQLCEYIYDFTPEREKFYWFKESYCRKLE